MNKRSNNQTENYCEVKGCQSKAAYKVTAVLGQKDGHLKKFSSKSERDEEGFSEVEHICKYHAEKAGLSLPKPLTRPSVLKKANRNSPCVCGSGKKFKVCCWAKVQKDW